MRPRLTLALVLLLAALPTLHGQPSIAPPKLVVIMVVDQMRADYIDRFQSNWSRGLKRLVKEGAWFRKAAYPYLQTVTCAGHATISTGALPHVHGIPANQWWDRDAGRQMACTEDPSVSNLGYDGPGKERNSGYRLKVPTLGDVLRTERGAHVVTLSAKTRSAIMLAGHGGQAVTWLSDGSDTWLTSSAFAAALVPAVKQFIDANPVDADYGKSWTRLLRTSRYREADEDKAERPPGGWTTAFPHVLSGTVGKADATFRAQWDVSPYSDAYAGRLAAALITSMQLGQHDTTDLLGISFSATDRIGHKFGPDSQELQDQLARLDRTIGDLLDHLDASVGRDRYVVALSADHGVTSVPERLLRTLKDGGRVGTADIINRIEAKIGPVLGAGKHVAMLDGRDMNLYFAPGVYEKLLAAPPLMKDLVEAIESAPGVRRAYRAEQLRQADPSSSDDWLPAAALSYVDGRSGDIVITLRPGWISSADAATHGTATDDDQRVPIIFAGADIKPGHYDQAVTPADIAPTLARLCGVALPHAEGKALTAALR
jgi:predicted AlkP superfamily pyrophosphatase or phosphodiesterase